MAEQNQTKELKRTLNIRKVNEVHVGKEVLAFDRKSDAKLHEEPYVASMSADATEAGTHQHTKLLADAPFQWRRLRCCAMQTTVSLACSSDSPRIRAERVSELNGRAATAENGISVGSGLVGTPRALSVDCLYL